MASLWEEINKFHDMSGFDLPAFDGRPVNRRYFVDGSNTTGRAGDGNDGLSFKRPLLTMSEVFTRMAVTEYDKPVGMLTDVYVMGVIKEQLVTPAGVFDVRIRGIANRPRQATSGGTATGGGSHWAPPASPTATTALLRIIEQGWQLENIQFLPHTSSSCIEIERNDGPPERDGSHAIIRGCRLVGGTTANGIVFKNGGYNCLIENNEFESLTGTAILSDGTSVQVPLFNKILNNRFNGCTNSIAISSVRGFIVGNIFKQAADDTNNKVNLVSVSAQGSDNMVLFNIFSDAAANITIAKGYKPGTTDVWRNWGTGAADAIVAVPT